MHNLHFCKNRNFFTLKKRILIVGYFGYYSNQLDGQTVKTRSVYKLVKENCKNAKIDYFDTENLKKTYFNLFKLIYLILCSSIIIFLPGQNNLKRFFPFLFFLSKIKKSKIIYIVVGGWLSEFLFQNKHIKQLLSRIDILLVESLQLKASIQSDFHIKNVVVFPNFRFKSLISNRNTNLSKGKSIDEKCLKIVFLGRIIIEKGVDTIFNFLNYYKNNRSLFASKIELHFYGQFFDSLDYFNEQSSYYDNSFYHGFIEPANIHGEISKYDLMILPTRYHGEGFPGAILDAYISGIPVIISNWRFLPEFVDDGITGFIYNLNNEQELYDIITHISNNPSLLIEMKKNALEKAEEYSPEKAWSILSSYLKN